MRAIINQNRCVGFRRYLLELSVPEGLAEARPGQFVHVRIEDSCDPLLRRPLSIFDAHGSSEGTRLNILYEVVGRGTQLLSEKASGVALDILGPLGHGFELKALEVFKTVFIVAGGMGVAPLHFLVKRLKENEGVMSVRILCGARTRDHLIGLDHFRGLGCEVMTATDDGSAGYHGVVTGLLRQQIDRGEDTRTSVICACGPKPMLASVASLAGEKDVPAFVSLEEFMGCGVGACLGCVIATTRGYERICQEGPVFDARDILWDD